MGGILDFIAEQNALSGIQDWAKQQYGQSNPGLASLAESDPRSFREILPSLIKTQQEQQAIQQYYGSDQQAAQANAGPDISAGPDNTTIDWNGPRQLPPSSRQDSALARIGSIANLPSALQSLAAQNLMFEGVGGGNAGASLSQNTASGDEYLKTLPPNIAGQVKGIAEGKISYPSTARNNPMNQFLRSAVEQYEPGFDATKWAERSKTARDFSPGGVSGQKITQAETAINHLAAMMGASTGVGGVDAGFASKPANAILNYFKNQNPDVITYNRFADMSGDEIAKFVAGNSGSTEADRRAQEDKLTINNSPDARKAAAQAAVQAVFGKLEPIAQQYNQSFGANKSPADFLSPEGRKSLAALGMLPDDGASPGQSGGSALAKMSAPQDDLEAQAQEAIKRGADPLGAFDDLIPTQQPSGLRGMLANAQMMQESGGNPNAVSPKGAMGLMQIMPGTGRDPGFGIAPLQNNSPEENVRLGDDYRNAMIEKYGGNTALGLMAYNWGPRNVDKWIANGGDPSKVPDETKKYLSGISQKMQTSSGAFDDLIPNQQQAGQTEAGGEGQSPYQSNIGKNQQSALAQLREFSKGNPETYYGNILPFSRDSKTGETSFDLTAPLRGMASVLADWFDPEMYAQTSGTEAGGQGPSFADLAGLAGISPTSPAARVSAVDPTVSGEPPIGNKALVAVSDAAKQVAQSVKSKPTATSQDFHALAQQSFDTAEKSGGVLTPEFTNKFIDDAKKMAPQTEAGKIVFGDNALTQLVGRMDALKNKPITLQGAMEIDEGLGNLIDKEYGIKGMSKEGKQIYDLQTKFRDLLDKADDSQLVGGKTGFDAWKQGQAYWSQMMAMRDVEKIMERAALTENPQTSLRTGFKNLYANKLRMRGFTRQAEKDAIKNAAQTGAVTSLLRIFGSRLIPITAAVGEGVAGGGLTGGLVTGTVAHGLSSASRAAATKLQMNRAQKALNTIAKRPVKGK